MARVRTSNTKHSKPSVAAPSKKNVVKKDAPAEISKQTDRTSKKSLKKDVKGKGKAKVVDVTTRGNEDGDGILDQLKTDIFALGGDESDFELVKDVDSDGDLAGEGLQKRSTDPDLSSAIANYVKELKIGPARKLAFKDVPEEDVKESGSSESESGDVVSGGKDHSEPAPAKETIQRTQEASTSKRTKYKTAIEPFPDWYNACPSLPPSAKPLDPPSPGTISKLQARAETLYIEEVTQYSSSPASNTLTRSAADAVFLQRVLSSGTSGDKLSALTLMVQSSPLHNAKALESLRGLAQKKGRDESLKALRAIVDWWIGGGAPNRKLKPFRDQPLTHPGVLDTHLIVWHFEDWLKRYFFSILQIIETLSLDLLPYVRTQALSLVFVLLRDKPEQEHNLLRLLVNKLGDSERPVASRASYHLLLLLQPHAQMKSIVVREITALMLRPSAPTLATSAQGTGSTRQHLKFTDDSDKAKAKKPNTSTEEKKKDLQQEHSKYYGTITLNQIVLIPEVDKDVARQLINVYFELFKEILGQGLDVDDKPAAGTTEESNPPTKEHRGKGDRGYEGRRERKTRKKDVRGEAGFTEVEDSSSRWMSAILTGVNRALPFAKLEVADVAFSKHIDTLFLITHTSTFNISLQALRLILQICTSLSPTSAVNASVSSRYYRRLYESLQDPRLASSSKQAMYLNLLFMSLKRDTNEERIKAFVRRFIQLLVSGGSGGAEFVAGGLYLLGELFNSVRGLREMLLSGPKEAPSDEVNTYDPFKRDPAYANPSTSPLWELTPLFHHYHPTVQLHASQLLQGKSLTANADLSLNTLSHFLDRFVYRNPKKPKPKGASAMQPGAGADDGTSVRIMKGIHTDVAGNVNDERFWKKSVKDVPVDQVFFHKYFSQKNKQEQGKAQKVAKRKKGNADEDEDVESHDVEGDDDDKQEEDVEEKEDGSDDEEEEEIWKAMKATMPKEADDDLMMDDSDDESVGGLNDAANDSDGSGMPFVDEDEDDLLGSDDELPEGLIAYDGSDVSSEDEGGDGEQEWGGIEKEGKRKRKAADSEKESDKKKKRKKLKSLPTFASYEDYAAMIDAGDGDEDMGPMGHVP